MRGRKIILTLASIFLFFFAFWLGRVTDPGHREADKIHRDVPSSSVALTTISVPGEHSEGEAHKHSTEGEKSEHSEGEAHGHSQENEKAVLKLSPEEQSNIGLKTVVADLRVIENVVHVAGVVKADPDKEAQISSRVAGISAAVFVRVGDRVRKGQKLAEIESVEIQKLQVDLIQAENRMLLTMAELERVKRLVASKIAARKELIAAQNRHQATLNEIEGLVQRLKLLGLPEEAVRQVRKEKNVSTFALRSPISGVVAERHIVLGETVEPDKVIFKILDASVVLVEGDAFEETLPQLRIGQRVRIRLPSYPRKLFTGRVTRFSPALDPQKRTLHLWAVVSNREGKLKPNLFADLDVITGGGGKVLAISLEAIISTEGESFVFVDKKGAFRRANLVLGARDDRYVEVKNGLLPGDSVVTDGKQQVYTKSLMARQGGAALGGHAH
ncbi:MAG: efflux RND transporter periplasmic adaptor subunit [Candidatus Binatia bacterium]